MQIMASYFMWYLWNSLSRWHSSSSLLRSFRYGHWRPILISHFYSFCYSEFDDAVEVPEICVCSTWRVISYCLWINCGTVETSEQVGTDDVSVFYLYTCIMLCGKKHLCGFFVFFISFSKLFSGSTVFSYFPQFPILYIVFNGVLMKGIT